MASTVPTVRSLVSELRDHLSPVEGFEADATAVTAVHVSELPDPTGYLSGGELLLTTGLALPPGRDGCDRYVARLREAGLAALAIGLGPVHRDPPKALVAACRAHGLTLLSVPEPTPFLTITRAYWAALSQAGERQLNDALAAQRALVDAAASADPAGAVLRLLARHLGGWAATLGPAGEVAVIHPPEMAGEAEALQAEVSRLDVAGTRSAASFIAADRYVVMFPMTAAERSVGYLAVGTRAQLDATARRSVLTACALLALDTMRSRAGENAQEVARRCVAALVDLGRVEAARDLAGAVGTPSLGPEVRLLAVQGDRAALTAAVLGRCPEAYAHPALPGEDGAWFLLPADHEPDGLGEVLAGADPDVRARLTGPVRLAEVAAARARASGALAGMTEGELDLGPAPGGVTAGVGAPLDRLVAAGKPALVEATAAYLRHRGQWEGAARSLGRHRNTLRYQISRARDLLQLDLDDPDVAARLWLTLRERGLA